MPRDLLADKTLESMPQLSREPAVASPPPEEKKKANPYGTAMIRNEDFFNKKKKADIHPFSSLLSVDDLDDCDWLEHAAFDPIEAASREKVSQFQSAMPQRFYIVAHRKYTCAFVDLLSLLSNVQASRLRAFPCMV